KVALMENLSHYGSGNLAEVRNHDNVNHNLINQAVQAMSLSEQSNIMNPSETEITSDSNIIPYSQYSVEIDNLKQTLSEHLKEKESLMQTDTLLKNDFQKEKSRNIDREIALEKQIKELNNIVFKINQSAQSKTNVIVIRDFEETLMLAKESRSKMLLKQKDLMMSEKKVNTKPVDYANSMNSPEPTPSIRPTQVEVPKELPKVSMVNTSLKKLKHHLASFDVVVKERTIATTFTEGTWGFKHTKACFRDEIIPFVKALKDLFNSFDQFLVDELRIQELLMILQQTCPRITDLGANLVAVTPKNKTKQVRHTLQITKSEKPSVGTSPSPNIDSNTPVLSSTGVALVSSASGSQSKDNTKKNRIRRTLKKAKETELEDHPRKVKSSLKKASVVDSRASSSIIKSVSNVNSDLKCAS
nr:hypothetical protein [Tanacetum cinerariifolium]